MAARKRKVNLTDEWKAKIKAAAIANRLYDHCLGLNEMSATQISAAKIVLNKLVPDLTKTEVEGPGEDGAHNISIGWRSAK